MVSGVACGVKASGKPDLALLSCPSGAKAAAVFTTNSIVAAPVEICRKHMTSKTVYGAVINSGNANACTGEKGMIDAMSMCRVAAEQFECDSSEVMIASTGIIGEKLPIDKIKAGIVEAAKCLSARAAAGKRFAESIMTTDTRPKQAVRKFMISGQEVTIAATAKGAGMIGPNMATTISVITTDVVISRSLLYKALKTAIGKSLNRLTVDGHQSTNDTAMILASGAAQNRSISSECPRFNKFQKELSELCSDLARQIAMDAEGATRIFRVEVRGALSKSDAAKAARAVADYDLVKCAVHGADPNWGRIICAVGSCGVKLNPGRLGCRIGGVWVFKNGRPAKFDKKKVSKIISQKEHEIIIELGSGSASDHCFGCDLSKEYVTINADYHT